MAHYSSNSGVLEVKVIPLTRQRLVENLERNVAADQKSDQNEEMK
jgi:hypothetical protein